MLPLGEQTSERLRLDLQAAEVVLGVLGPDTSESAYVLTELVAEIAQVTSLELRRDALMRISAKAENLANVAQAKDK